MSPCNDGALAIASSQLGIALSEHQSERLHDYLALLTKWNRVYNLTGVRNPSDMMVRHLVDSMAIIAPLRRWGTGKAYRLLDAGSGAGLPGAVISVLMPEVEVTCVDASGKKALFIRQVAGELGIKNLQAVHARVEELSDVPFSVVTSRAFASLAVFATLTRRHVDKDSIWLAMKAGLPAAEIAVLPPDIDAFHVEQLSVPGLDADRCLVWMKLRAH